MKINPPSTSAVLLSPVFACRDNFKHSETARSRLSRVIINPCFKILFYLNGENVSFVTNGFGILVNKSTNRAFSIIVKLERRQLNEAEAVN